MADAYFLVSKYPNDDEPTDVAFTPINIGVIPKEYLSFKAEVESFVSTIKVLFAEDIGTQRHFFNEIYFASELCFSGEKSDLFTANQTLTEIKDKLTSVYWGKVRNKVLIRYGIAALVTSALLFLGYFFNIADKEFYFVGLIGTCLGSWLSLAIRTKQLVFNDIRQHITEVSSPFIRCVFACGLSFCFFLFFQVGFIEFTLGGITSSDISENLEVALTLGILFGFGEKLLISTIGEKSNTMLK